jgi:hypothetical protein
MPKEGNRKTFIGLVGFFGLLVPLGFFFVKGWLDADQFLDSLKWPVGVLVAITVGNGIEWIGKGISRR